MGAAVISKKILVFLGLFFLTGLFADTDTWAYSFSDWYHGASGYEQALNEALRAEKPLVLYFHTEWCNWSKKMNNEYLANYEVRRFLGNIPKAEIDPDKGAAEKALAGKYNVSGYPSFLVFVPSLKGKAKRVHPFKKRYAWPTDKFLHAIREKIARQYDNKAHACFKAKDYEEALGYLDKAVEFNPEDAYSYYLQGRIKYTVAHRAKNPALLQEAEGDYLQALRIDPNQEGAKKDLEQLHELMEHLGIR